MPKKEVPLHSLRDYIPEGTYEPVLHYLQLYHVHLTITRKRESLLGDYRHAHRGKAHRISVNSNLNKYNFLITLLHEMAHLVTFEQFGNRVQPHGREWKNIFSSILAHFTGKGYFPSDIEASLLKTLKNPAASTCGDENLLRVLKKYDSPKKGLNLVEDLPNGQSFKIKGDRIFIKGEKIRTRYQCFEPATKKWYLFSGLYEVQIVNG
ncbi:MAG: SprT-like domain-containing protein [Bacteroidetes bacterium]|nr:SprT-like domain-containing protein [Bacteroidota bacterium]